MAVLENVCGGREAREAGCVANLPEYAAGTWCVAYDSGSLGSMSGLVRR
jgi:hypothetical protein